jgi:hypothetical protein
MSFRNSRRALRALVVVVLALLPALPARALPLDGARFGDDRGAVMGFFDELRSFWLGLWGKEGITIDPHGTAGALRKEGMSIDPNGRPTGTNPEPTSDNGMLIDPHG